MAIHVLGIRHHGPGSARNVAAYLKALKPDIILVEGPPEADSILQWATHTELKPPVAILCYQPDAPQQSVFYPFAEFSPEWQAIVFAKQNNIPVRFFDLPIAHQFAMDNEKEEKEKKENAKEEDGNEEKTSLPEAINEAVEITEAIVVKRDPIAYLAEAAGYDDGEKWWEQMFECRHHNEEVFEAVTEAMQCLRQDLTMPEDLRENLREAYMRKMIRQAEKELYTTIAVVCGAWHAPAMVNMPKQKEDNELLKNLPKVKVECTWIPWTYGRLSYYSGYGAGIASPGWYEHLWHYPQEDGTRWMSKVASLFRKNGMDTSVAHVIEAVRLAEGLASLRALPKAGLEELNEATLSVLCNGETVRLQLIQNELIVSNKIGEVPIDIPKPPLQVDIEKLQKSLRLPATADFKDYTFDLRKENDLQRSVLLHRLRLLDIRWGQQTDVSGKGTFKEQWRLQWEPSIAITIIDKGSWGNTVEEATNKYLIHQAETTTVIATIAKLLSEALPADLHGAVQVLIQRLNNLAAASGDVLQLMEAIPSLVNIARYGNVRKTDADVVLQIVSSMITRVCIGLPNAVTGIAEEAAQTLIDLLQQLHNAVSVLQEQHITNQWQQTLHHLSAAQNTAPLISGYSTRLLFEYKILVGDTLVKAFHFRMSAANMPAASAAWLEGFLKGSGSVLLLDQELWNLVNQWVAGLAADAFTDVLPLLRRTFANFTPPERKKLGEKVKSGGQVLGTRQPTEIDIDIQRAKQGLPVVLQLFGIKQTIHTI